jgi:O-antigen/teichoic acid export membrane protein
VLGALSTQLDRIAISKLLSLEYMGYYAIAGSAVGFLRIISGSIMRAVSPKMVVDLALDAKDSLSRTYHQTSQVMAFLAAGAGWALAFFAREILLLWIRSEVIAQETHVAMAFLSIGTMLGIIASVQYNLCLATGSTKIPLVVSSIVTALLAPAMFLLIPKWGIVGAALPWMLLHLSFYVVWPYWLHQHVLPGQAGRWIMRDTLPFVVLGLICFGISKSLVTFVKHPLAWYPMFGMAGLVYVIVGSSWLPTRFRLWTLYKQIRHGVDLRSWKVHV